MDFFERLLLEIAQFRISFDNCANISVSGDFNARTAHRPDYVAHDDLIYMVIVYWMSVNRFNSVL